MTDGVTAPPPLQRESGRLAVLRQKATELESVFLAEMLGEAGLGEVSTGFGGGIGEEQFASFLRQEQARAIVAHGGIGLSESLFRALVKEEARNDS
ncbi:Rod binding protein [Gemmobacter aquatilis]|uniref:Rod binding protein n=1 Tax=Gemmobacter aquatilis TaxID=933059 RepID=A0A1H7YJK8_9RHOB|nr:rod-binding protein [Gemmobacter aquatilis]SEM46143.1 Rod binding protein [Gemmobacter aquatilis]